VVSDPAELTPPQASRLRRTIAETNDRLREAIEDLDPIKHPGFVFEPSNPTIAGRIVGLALLARARKPLSFATEKFYGSGVYAIYYNGDFPAYSGISGKEQPIYVGKADPTNPNAKTVAEQLDRLSRRLNDHRKTIAKASATLKLEDFEFRALVVQSGYESAAENYLIHLFRPIWNNEPRSAVALASTETAPKPAGISGLHGIRFILAETKRIVIRRCRMLGRRTASSPISATTLPPIPLWPQ